MAQAIDSVSCGNDYTGAATLQDVYAAGLRTAHSNGGYFNVTGNDAFVRLQWYTANGQSAWTPEFHAPVGPYTISPGTTGVQFRNYVAGSTAVVSAGIFYPAQPVFTTTGAGTVAVAAAMLVTGSFDSTGAITLGTGFTVNHSGTGTYIVTFNPAFAAAPVVLAVVGQQAAALVSVSAGVSTTTVQFNTRVSSTGAAGDEAVNFVAFTTV